MKKLAIISSHPIQYNAPMFKMLSTRGNLQIKVFYTWSQSEKGAIYDPGFGKQVEWDIPLLEGYDFTFVNNISKRPGTDHFTGIVNPTLNTEVENWSPDAILIFGWAFQSHLKCIRYFTKKVPIIFRGDSTLLGEMPGIRLVVRTLFLKWVYTHIDSALYVGTNNKKYFLRHGVKENQLTFAPHAIDNSRFNKNAPEYNEQALVWRRSIGIADSDIVFLFAGKLEVNKNAQILLSAFRFFSHQKDLHVIILGNGLMEKKLKEEYSNMDNVHFIDFQNQSMMPVVYRLGNIFVLPSKGPVETWGLAINEAMACSRAVIVSDRCGAAIDLVKMGQNGYIFKNNNKQDLIEKMGLLINNKEQLELIGRKSKEIIDEWTFENICHQVESVVLHQEI